MIDKPASLPAEQEPRHHTERCYSIGTALERAWSQYNDYAIRFWKRGTRPTLTRWQFVADAAIQLIEEEGR